MAFRFKPTDYVLRTNGKIRYQVLKLLKSNRKTIYNPNESADVINKMVYQCISDKGATYYFIDEELEPWKEML
jgi:hypothetical protein